MIELLCSPGVARALHLLAYSGDVQTAAAVLAANPALADHPDALVNAAAAAFLADPPGLLAGTERASCTTDDASGAADKERHDSTCAGAPVARRPCCHRRGEDECAGAITPCLPADGAGTIQRLRAPG